MKLSDFRHVYFLGIGGIGMSALARWFMANRYWVGGYDKTCTDLTLQLESEGVDIHYDDKSGRIPTQAYQKAITLVIYTPAVPKEHVELEYFNKENYTVLKRAQVLGLIAASKFTIAVAGTHGKTTTSSMLAHILHYAGLDPSAFIGGIMVNYNSNLLIGKSNLLVVEADEFDRSFLQLFPDIAVVTSTDADHLDIYQTHDALKASFQDFVKQVKQEGKVIINNKLDIQVLYKTKITYALSDGQVNAKNININKGIFTFDCYIENRTISDLQLHLPGYHNIENALAAITIAAQLGISDDVIKSAINTYKGVKRRFEKVLETSTSVLLDDYAHHPEEIKSFLTSVKALYPNRKLTCVFQPHLFSRTRDFSLEFAKSLSIADEVFMLDIYPARELPIPGITSDTISKRITKPVYTCNLENCVSQLSKHDISVICTLGAGNIDKLVSPIAEMLVSKSKSNSYEN